MPKQEHGYATVIEHIEEFRRRLIRCLVAVCLLLPAAWPFSQMLIDWIVNHLCPPELGSLYYTAPMELFFLRLKFSLIMAVCVALPVLSWHLWRYFSPGLYRHEKTMIRCASGFSFFLFLGGAAMGLLVIFPILMNYSLSMQTPGIKPLINVTSCLGMAAWLMLGFGICFQLPIVLLGIIRLGLVSVSTLRRLRPYIVVGIFSVAMVLTPPDIISQLCMGVPTWLLYEISLILGRFVEPTRQADPATSQFQKETLYF